MVGRGACGKILRPGFNDGWGRLEAMDGELPRLTLRPSGQREPSEPMQPSKQRPSEPAQAREPAQAGEPAQAATPRAAALALISVCLGFFVIQREIGGSLAGLQWVIDAYTLALASIMLTAGAAADRIGARKIFTFGLTTFVHVPLAVATAGYLIAATIAWFTIREVNNKAVGSQT
jgi:DHA2 family methylenomycin A resistance protein-like MFS transporter